MFDDILKNLFNETKQKIEKQKKSLSEIIIEHQATDNKISIKINGDGKIVDLKISEDLLKENHEMLEDLLVVNLNKAIEKLDEVKNKEMEKIKGEAVPNIDELFNSFISDEEE